MARTINQSFLLGDLGGDAEFRTLASGEEVATLRLATSRSYRRADGEWADETEWHDVILLAPAQAGAGADPGEGAARESGAPSPGGSDDNIPF